MPTYQYSCTDCGHFFEAVQSFSDDSLTVCPVCEGRLRKVFNAVGVVFKGSGFYRTDSRSGQGSKDGAGEGSSTKDAGDGAGTGKGKGDAPAAGPSPAKDSPAPAAKSGSGQPKSA